MPKPKQLIRKRITAIDSRIFADLLKAQRSLPIKQIALRNNITWPTANLHVKKLQNFKVLNIEKTIRKNRVSVNPKFVLDINKILLKEKRNTRRSLWK